MSEKASPQEQPIVNFKNISIFYDNREVLRANFEVYPKEIIVITGETGSGKSTLFRSIYGDVKIKGDLASVLTFNLLKLSFSKIPKLRRHLGIIFQESQFLYDRTVYENLHFVLRGTGWKKNEEIKKRIEEVASLCLLENKLNYYPYQLSGGEQKRLMIARAILNSPPIILADEPYTFLDENSVKVINDIFLKLNSKGTTLLLTAHKKEEFNIFPNARFFKIENGYIYEVM